MPPLPWTRRGIWKVQEMLLEVMTPVPTSNVSKMQMPAEMTMQKPPVTVEDAARITLPPDKNLINVAVFYAVVGILLKNFINELLL